MWVVSEQQKKPNNKYRRNNKITEMEIEIHNGFNVINILRKL